MGGFGVGMFDRKKNWNLTLIPLSSRVRVAIECKFSSTPKPARGFHEAMVDLEADKGFAIAPVREAFDLSAKVRVLPINDLAAVWGALG